MKHKLHSLQILLASAVAFSIQTAQAQSGMVTTTPVNNTDPMTYDAPAAGRSSSYGAGTSWLPYTTRGYVGLNLGQADYDLPCTAGFSCDDSNKAFKLYTGGMFNENFGLELAYLQAGEAERAGGEIKARGLNLSLIGVLPFNETFEVFGKIGATYGWTRTTASALSGAATGKEEGAGPSYGLGLNIFFTPNWGAVVEWERQEFEFAGDREEDIELTTVGVKYRF